jgi:hypothetical protein
MATPTTSADPLVEALSKRLRVMDLVGWQRVATWAEESDLSFEDLRLLLALARKVDDGAAAVSELAELAGFSLDVAYPATHRLRGRGCPGGAASIRPQARRAKSSSQCWTPHTARASRHTSTSIPRNKNGYATLGDQAIVADGLRVNVRSR